MDEAGLSSLCAASPASSTPAAARAVEPCRAAAHERLAAPPRPRRRQPAHRARPGLRPPPPVDHRRRHRPAAAVQRRRLGGRGLQRRDLQLPGTDPRAAGRWATASTPRATPRCIVHAWEQWGEDCVKRFRGMFAFALWDRNRQTLFMARDRLGVKPLYYALLDDGTLLFGSELKSLLAYRRTAACSATSTRWPSRSTSRSATWPSRARIFRQAQQAAAGAHAWPSAAASRWPSRASTGTCTSRSATPAASRTPAPNCVERLRESVRLRMISEVPLGAFLSGGVDSSAVVATMAGLSDGPVNTCSIAFDDPQVQRERVRRRWWPTATAPTTASRPSSATTSTSSTRWRGCTTSPTPTARPSPPTASASSRAST